MVWYLISRLASTIVFTLRIMSLRDAYMAIEGSDLDLDARVELGISHPLDPSKFSQLAELRRRATANTVIFVLSFLVPWVGDFFFWFVNVGLFVTKDVGPLLGKVKQRLVQANSRLMPLLLGGSEQTAVFMLCSLFALLFSFCVGPWVTALHRMGQEQIEVSAVDVPQVSEKALRQDSYRVLCTFLAKGVSCALVPNKDNSSATVRGDQYGATCTPSSDGTMCTLDGRSP